MLTSLKTGFRQARSVWAGLSVRAPRNFQQSRPAWQSSRRPSRRRSIPSSVSHPHHLNKSKGSIGRLSARKNSASNSTVSLIRSSKWTPKTTLQTKIFPHTTWLLRKRRRTDRTYFAPTKRKMRNRRSCRSVTARMLCLKWTWQAPMGRNHAQRSECHSSVRQSFLSALWIEARLRVAWDSTMRSRSTSKICRASRASTSGPKWTKNFSNDSRKEKMMVLLIAQTLGTKSTDRCRMTSSARFKLSSTCEPAHLKPSQSSDWLEEAFTYNSTHHSRTSNSDRTYP